jgi:NosR/NirI family nitrous oxide reductase transcriptional regulator
MKKLRNMKIFRIVVQVLFLIFLPGLVGLTFLEIKSLFTDLFAGNLTNIFSDTGVLLVISLSTMLFGRFFCGWMCAFGAYNDWLYLIGKKIFKINYHVDEENDYYLKYLKYLVLILIITLLWTNIITLPTGSSPWDAFGSLMNPVYAFENYTIGFIILVIISIGSLFIERFFCRYLCPLGAYFSIISKLKLIEISKEKSVCGPCKACTLKCPMGINLDAVNSSRSGECINCFNCVSVCPKNNAKVKLNNKVLNEYALASLVLSTTTGLTVGANTINPNSAETTVTKTLSDTYQDGTYTGTGTGYRPNTEVSVTIKNNKITSIELISTNDTEDFFNRAWSSIKNAILNNQSTKVSTVSGATRSSNGIIEAVNDALNSAKNGTTSNSTSSSSTNSNSSNSSSSSSTTNNSNSSTDNYSTTDSNNNSSSTTSSSIYQDGTYTGTGNGYRPNTQVSVTINSGKITSIELISTNDTDNFFNRAWSSLKNAIITAQSTKVSTVSGATRSSNGIIEAVNDALSQAQN